MAGSKVSAGMAADKEVQEADSIFACTFPCIPSHNIPSIPLYHSGFCVPIVHP